MHICEKIYALSEKPVYGNTEGVCRITGKQSLGLPFDDWVRGTFTDHAFLKPGNIISNEALLCFDEASAEIQRKTGKDKPQRFRNYSHIVADGEWHCLTKADKKKIIDLLPCAEVVCLADSGQKHIIFKARDGLWQLDDLFVMPDIDTFRMLHSKMMEMLTMGFIQEEIRTGNYIQGRIAKAGLSNWRPVEAALKDYRGSRIFTFTAWLMYSTKSN